MYIARLCYSGGVERYGRPRKAGKTNWFKKNSSHFDLHTTGVQYVVYQYHGHQVDEGHAYMIRIPNICVYLCRNRTAVY